jgi:ribosomal protein S18 acetylase RimI-like enzyme
MNNKEYIFEKLDEGDIPVIFIIAEEIILNYYVTFLDKNIVNEYINSKQFKDEIIENVENCTVMKIKNKIIGFSIIIENKIHLIMISIEYQNNNYGSILIEYMENKLFEKYEIIELQSFTKNNIANKFYIKNKWKKTEEINIDGLELYKYNKYNEKNIKKPNVI